MRTTRYVVEPENGSGSGHFSDPPLFVLASLASGPKHGHAMIEDIASFCGIRLGPGTLYGAIARLEQQGWIEPLAPEERRQPYRITADVEIPEGGAEGVLMTQGGRFNGLGLYLLQGRPIFDYNLVGIDRTTLAAKDALTPGKHTIALDFKYDGGGIGKGGLLTLTVDGKEVADGKLARTIPFRVSADETFDIGEDTGMPVSEDYHVPFKFNGTLNKVVIDLG